MPSTDALNAVQDMLEEKLRELEDLKQAQFKIPEVEREILSLRHVFEMMGGKESKTTASQISSAINQKVGSLTIPQATEKVLRDAQQALHLKIIRQRLSSSYNMHVSEGSLFSAINRNMKKGQKFKREGPNTFGLQEWNRDNKSRQENEQITQQN